MASVSCIYGLGSPEQYEGQLLRTVAGTDLPLEFAMQRLVDIQYQRNNMSRARGTFRVQGDTLEVFPSYEQTGYRIEWWGDTIERISRFDPLTGELLTDSIADLTTFPASHYVAGDERMKHALVTIEEELHERLARARVARASCSKPNACGCGRPTTSRCSARSASARGSRTTRGTSTAGRPAARRTRCSTTSPTTTSS